MWIVTYKKIKIGIDYIIKKLNLKKTTLKLNSWIGHAQNADTFFVNKMIKKCDWLYDGKNI